LHLDFLLVNLVLPFNIFLVHEVGVYLSLDTPTSTSLTLTQIGCKRALSVFLLLLLSLHFLVLLHQNNMSLLLVEPLFVEVLPHLFFRKWLLDVQNFLLDASVDRVGLFVQR